METKGFVSLWIGKMQTAEELERLLAVSYTDEGDFIPSLFVSVQLLLWGLSSAE